MPELPEGPIVLRVLLGGQLRITSFGMGGRAPPAGSPSCGPGRLTYRTSSTWNT